MHGDQRNADIDQQTGHILRVAHDAVDPAVNQSGGVDVAPALHFSSGTEGEYGQPAEDR